MHLRFPRLACAASLSLALLAGCAAPLANVPTVASGGATPATPIAPGDAAPATGAPIAPQPLVWSTLSGQATFRGEPLAHAQLRVVDALTDRPAHVVNAGATVSTADKGSHWRAGRSAVVGVETEALTTDAQGRFNVKVAGLVSGMAVRLVVVTGDNALAALVNGVDAKGERLVQASDVQIDAISTYQAHMAFTAVKTSVLLPQAKAGPHIQLAIADLAKMRPQLERALASSPRLANDLAAETDPLLGTPRLTPAGQREAAENVAYGKAFEAFELRVEEVLAKGELDVQGLAPVTARAEAFAQAGRIDAQAIGELQRILEAEIAKAPGQGAAKQSRSVLQAPGGLFGVFVVQFTGAVTRTSTYWTQFTIAQYSSKLNSQFMGPLSGVSSPFAARFDALNNATSQAGLEDPVRSLHLSTVSRVAEEPGDETGQPQDTPAMSLPLPGTDTTLKTGGGTLTMSNRSGDTITIDVNNPDSVQQALGTGPNSAAQVLSPSRSNGSGGSSNSGATGFTDSVSTNMSAETGQALVTVTTAAEPTVLGLDGDNVWIGLKNPNKLMLLAQDGAVTKSWAIDGVPVAVTRHGTLVYVACSNGNLYGMGNNLEEDTPQLVMNVSPGLKGMATNGSDLLLLTTEGQAAWLSNGAIAAVTQVSDPFTALFHSDGAPIYATTASGDMKALMTGVGVINVSPMDMPGDEATTRFTMAPYGEIDDFGHVWTIGESGALKSWLNSDGWTGPMTVGTEDWRPQALAYTGVDDMPRLFVADGTHKQVRVYFPVVDEPTLEEGDVYPVDGAPTELVADSAGNLWVVCPSTHKVLLLKKIFAP